MQCPFLNRKTGPPKEPVLYCSTTRQPINSSYQETHLWTPTTTETLFIITHTTPIIKPPSTLPTQTTIINRPIEEYRIYQKYQR